MRLKNWKESLVDRLTKHLRSEGLNWQDDYPGKSVFWEIELGLFAIEIIFPEQKLVDSLWILLTGYSHKFTVPEIKNLNAKQRKNIANARHLLEMFQGRLNWNKNLEAYSKVPEFLRGYEVNLETGEIIRKEITFASDRFDIYDRTLSDTLDYSQRSIKWATAGKYTVFQEDLPYPITITQTEASFANSVRPHTLQSKTERKKISVILPKLINNARWMDKERKRQNKKSRNWEKRLKKIELKLIKNGTISKDDRLEIDGLFNLVGPVGTGKSTLMEVLAVYAAKNDLHVTLIVPDVVDVLKRARLFTQLGIKAAPILGFTNRKKHLNRWHRNCAIENPDNKITLDPAGFQWVDSGCILNDKLDDLFTDPSQYPCLNLKQGKKTFACPMFSVCNTHKAARELVDAKIWLATPASLIYTKIPPQINPENLRYGELIYRRSDLVIWDEVDRGMAFLDSVFNPNQELIEFLDNLRLQIDRKLAQKRRKDLKDSSLNNWQSIHNRLQATTDQIIHLLTRDGSNSLKDWLTKKADYFTEIILFDRIIEELFENKESEEYKKLSKEIEDYLSSKTNPQNPHYSTLSNATNNLILGQDRDSVRNNLDNWLKQHKTVAEQWEDRKWNDIIDRLEFTLLIHAFARSLQTILNNFTIADSQLKLNLENSALLNRPPLDFRAIVPVSPPGNLLGFQYIQGGLRFFKLTGLGRWIPLNFHQLYADEGIIGPNVLLMSGTSWADRSPGFHLQIPVNGILQPDDREAKKIIKDSQFFLESFSYGNSTETIRVSGKQGHDRETALKELVKQLASNDNLGKISKLEIEKNNLAEGRKKILLLTGSYSEAKTVSEHLIKIRPNWDGSILKLVSDDAAEDDNNSNFTLRRGNVEQFGKIEDAWILVAPLLAIERGHNILNESGFAAIGACYFLVRPHPVPYDLNLCLQMLNHWTLDKLNAPKTLKSWCGDNFNLIKLGQEFRNRSYLEWCRILKTKIQISTLEEKDRQGLIWNAIVVMNQVIGRLNRGGCGARVYFCDAAFADFLPYLFEELKPYFEENSSKYLEDKAIAQALYSNFYYPLKQGLNQ